MRVAASLDDRLYLRVGFTGAPGFLIDATINGGRAWSPWVLVEHLKNFDVLSTPYATGGENYSPRFAGDTDTEFDNDVNALRANANRRMELRARVGSDGYLRFWASDGWARLGSVLVETSYLAWA